MIVVDTLSDDRFADNPLVLGGPRIGFYAGYPLTLDDGSCSGTSCLLDTRPHTFKVSNLEQLRDLALIVTEQFRALRVERARGSSEPMGFDPSEQ
jgi:GAF domain-containing protein